MRDIVDGGTRQVRSVVARSSFDGADKIVVDTAVRVDLIEAGSGDDITLDKPTLDQNRDIVSDVYLSWFGARLHTGGGWVQLEAEMSVTVSRDQFVPSMTVHEVEQQYARFAEETGV